MFVTINDRIFDRTNKSEGSNKCVCVALQV